MSYYIVTSCYIVISYYIITSYYIVTCLVLVSKPSSLYHHLKIFSIITFVFCILYLTVIFPYALAIQHAGLAHILVKSLHYSSGSALVKTLHRY